MAQRGTSSASAQRIPWVTETVDKYRLSENDLLRFLRKIFGEYDSRVFGIQKGGDGYQFFAPRELTEDEKDEKLENYRSKQTLTK